MLTLFKKDLDIALLRRQTISAAPVARLAPPLCPNPSEWANQFYQVCSGSEIGLYRSDRAPYQVGILDVYKEPGIDTLVLMTSAQVGKSLTLLVLLAYWIKLDPGPMLLIQPTVLTAEEFSRERIDPSIKNNPVLHDCMPIATKVNGNTILKKNFLGGFLAIVGANSPAGLASRSIRYLFADEIDRWPPSAGEEGDPLTVAAKRLTTYWNRFTALVSTPTLTRTSRITAAYRETDQRRFFVSCPACEQLFYLQWSGIYYHGKDTSNPDFSSIFYRCPHCEEAIPETGKSGLISTGRWVATNLTPIKPTAAGFHLNELYSPWRQWADVARDYETSRSDPMRLRVWVNTSMGEPWDTSDEERLHYQDLIDQAQKSNYQTGQVPEGVVILAAGVDVQHDRLEVAVWGWSKGEKGWLIDYQKIYGDPRQSLVWAELETFLANGFDANGVVLRPYCTFVDSGNWTQEVYAEVKQRIKLNWHPIKGRAGEHRALMGTPSSQETRRNGTKLPKGLKLTILGVDLAKATLFNRLNLPDDHPKKLQFPSNLPSDYFEGLASEVRVLKHRGGQPYFVWEKVPGVERNEPLDTAVYGYCAGVRAGIERINWDKELDAIDRQRAINKSAQAGKNEPVQAATPKAPRRRKSGYYDENP